MRNVTWSCEDYKELLRLLVIYLRGVVKRVHSGQVTHVTDQIRKPGGKPSSWFFVSICSKYLCQNLVITDNQNIQDAIILSKEFKSINV